LNRLNLDQILSEKLRGLEDKINTCFPETLNSVKIGLAVAGILSFKNNLQPTTLIYSGPSGSGKTLPLGFMLPNKEHEDLTNYIYRCDNFTPKAFVSHAANVRADKLKDIDLLPKIDLKLLITKELAPIFRGSRDELIDRFSILISVLDGKGLVTSSGSRGTRGYDYPINFCWLGATTPLSNETHKLMSQLGTRILFYNTDRKEKTLDDLLKFAKRNDNPLMEEKCRELTNDFMMELFRMYPSGSFDVNKIEFEDRLLRQLVLYSKTMAILRAFFTFKEGDDDFADRHGKPQIEKEERAIIILKNIALGSALIHGRDYVDDYDISQIKHIALSSMPEMRRIIFEALLKCSGFATTDKIIEHTKFSKKTSLHYMKELGHLGICNYEDSADGDASSIELDDRFNELVEDRIVKNEAELNDFFDSKDTVS
jgi:hypothetical protein